MMYRRSINNSLKAFMLGTALGTIAAVSGGVFLSSPVMAQSSAPVPVRSADHPGYSRIVFAFNNEFIDYRLVDRANSFTLYFPAGQNFQNNGAIGALQFATNPVIGTDISGEASISFTKGANSMAQAYRDGFAIVVDVMPIPAGVQPAFDQSQNDSLASSTTNNSAANNTAGTPPVVTNNSTTFTDNLLQDNPLSLNQSAPDASINLGQSANGATSNADTATASAGLSFTDMLTNPAATQTNDQASGATNAAAQAAQTTSEGGTPTAANSGSGATPAEEKPADQSADIEDPMAAIFGPASGSSNSSETASNEKKPETEAEAPKKVVVEQEPDPIPTFTDSSPDIVRSGNLQPNRNAGVSVNRRLGLGQAPVVPVSVEALSDTKTLIFNWHVPVGAAIFKRSGYLWVVFDEASVSELSEVVSMMNGEFTTIDQSNGPDLTVVRFGLLNDPKIVASRVGNDWRVTLQDTDVDPENPLVLTRQESDDQGIRYFAPIQSPGNYLKVADPVVGDNIHIVPVLEQGMGMTNEYRQGPFKALKTAQGLVIEPLSDDVVITRYTDGVAIGSLWGGNGTGSGSSAAGGRMRGEVIIDFEKWRMGPKRQFNQNRQKLMLALASAPESEVNEHRWEIAKFYLAHGMPHETMSVLNLMLELDATLPEKDHRFNAVRGMAHYQMRDFALAKQFLDDRRLDAEPDIYLWRTLTETALGNYADALKVFERSRELIDRYDPETRVNFRLAAVKASLNVGRLDFAQNELALIKSIPQNRFQQTEAQWLEGQLMQALGKVDEASQLYRRVALQERVNRRASSQARFALIMMNYNNNVWDRNRTTNELEMLRFSWRGDDFEFNLLQRLGALYLDGKEYTKGLRALRDAINSFPDHARRSEIYKAMDGTFRKLFVGGEANRMNTISAISLFNEFKELQPYDADGDEMVRRLVERMVSVDLLGQAEELLDHQVRVRLEGIAQSSIAVQLAKIYLMDQKPDQAIEIIRATRQPQMPDDLVKRRTLVEARALTNSKRYEEAEVLLFGVSGDEANTIRADIYWGANDWPRIAMVSIQMLGNRWQVPTPLSFEERQVLMRYVIAMSMQGDQAALRRVRDQYKDLMKNGDYANAFNTITSMQNPSGSDLAAVVRSLAGIDTLRSFMDAYRREFVSSSD